MPCLESPAAFAAPPRRTTAASTLCELETPTPSAWSLSGLHVVTPTRTCLIFWCVVQPPRPWFSSQRVKTDQALIRRGDLIDFYI